MNSKEMGRNTNSRGQGQNIGRFGQSMGRGEERTHGVDKMDTERNSQEGKLETQEEEGLG